MAKSKKRKKSKVRRIATDIIIICLAGIVALSGWKVYTILRDYHANTEIYNKIAEAAMPNGWNGDVDFDVLRKINPDIAAWLYYEGTNINYPIVMPPDNDYYLRLGFDGTWAIGGTLFIDAITERPFEQFNTIVYGHHMQDGSMFGDIKYLKETDFVKSHPQFELVTPEGKYHLRICAFLNQPADSSIYTTNFADSDVVNKQAYIDLIRSLALYVTTEPMTIDDNLVILSTCAYEYQDARYVVVCRKIPAE